MPERVAQAPELGLERDDLARAALAAPLQPREGGRAHDQQHEQHLGRAPERRDLPARFGRDACRVAPAAGVVARARFEDVELEGRTGRPKADHVAVLQGDVAVRGLPVDERAVLAAQVAEQKGLTLSDDRGVTGGDVEIALRVEARVRKGMPAQPDVGLTKHLDLAGASAGQEPKLGFHGLRTKRYK